MKHSVYVFFDPRYETGVKVGCGNLARCLHDAQGYSPEGLRCEGAWSFKSRQEMTAAEAAAHQSLKQAGISRLLVDKSISPRNGVEWFDATSTQAIQHLQDLFNRPASSFKISSFRRDKVLSMPEYQGRLVLWLFQEILTGRIKISACSEFLSPRAASRRYSRNGYKEVAAFVIDPPISLSTNERLFALRNDLTARYGYGDRSQHFGWLRDGITLEHITADLRIVNGLRMLNDLNDRPAGVRPSYTGAGAQVPKHELATFSEIWWHKSPVTAS